MKEKIRLFFFIKVFKFILLNEYAILCSKVSNVSKNFDKKHDDYRKSGIRFYGLVVVHKNERISNIERMNGGIPNIGVYEIKDISNNNKGTKGKNKKQCKSSLNNKGVLDQAKDVKSSAHTEGITYSDKGTLKNKNYVKKVRGVVRTGFKFLRKFIDRKGVLFNFLFILHLGLAILITIAALIEGTVQYTGDVKRVFPSVLRSLLIFWILFLLGIFCICRKAVKHEKLTHMKSEMHHKAHTSLSTIHF
ncbi:hypothetical protein MKS88_004047 [Plasmodium brasilianum]|uniref:Fam-h protein n=2 Tax=Plasmodium (Plasmodium) TaxID=418103 RepID=A0A1D3SNR9_PLAMA|nr:Plasmodium exported protein, unknown function [Plasmodium malariae]KAI4836259.1 hypothetical protein MKS88_004047 [Plasmodium brasilianum]SCO93518.1 Plasmodium exported protein, unknown function [Plasmodium malariae]